MPSAFIHTCIHLLINTASVTQQVERGGFLHNKGWWGGQLCFAIQEGAKIYVFEWEL